MKIEISKRLKAAKRLNFLQS